jgi:hypothetical protein
MSVEERYLELCLHLRRHDEELVDAYYGPADIAERVVAGPMREPADLVTEAQTLAETATPYLQAQLRGLQVLARKLAGETIGYTEQVEQCYGLQAQRVPEARFQEAHDALEAILPGDGRLAKRYGAWLESGYLPTEQILPVTSALNDRLRARTAEVFGLPEGESTELGLVSGEHWSAYNHYLGGLRSRVVINTDIPVRASIAAHLVAHELYPGHHTEHAWKEQVLYRERGKLDESALMYGTPACVINEGIAELAIELVVDDQDAFTADVLDEFGIAYDADLGRRIREARKPLERVPNNAALLLHEDGASSEEAKEYVEKWALVPAQRAEKTVAFVADPVGGPYITTYTDGYDLCSSWVAGDPARFKRLLTEQLTPADLT